MDETDEIECLRSMTINELIGSSGERKKCFVIPSYQRGYRWDADQINKLLDDIYGFYQMKGNPSVGDFYCLQPIVVKPLACDEAEEKIGSDSRNSQKDFDYYEVVDGQQRLTTLFILLKKVLRMGDPFDIAYERDKSVGYLREKLLYGLPGTSKAKTLAVCADEYYILQAWETADDWFRKTMVTSGNRALLSNLEDALCNFTKVIWYELDKGADCYAVFKNINNGKIPLTDAELVKAMLLNAKNFASPTSNEQLIKQEQNRYARLWDEIQKAFSDNEFWSFITGGSVINLPTRIDYLVLLTVKLKNPSYLGSGDHKLFSYFEEEIAKATSKTDFVEKTFNELKNSFRTLQDWNDDYRLHNYIGYILSYLPKDPALEICTLANEYNARSKNDFLNYLIEEIRKPFANLSLAGINYEDNRQQVEKLLMLFNIEELNKLEQKFNFYIKDGDGRGKWSVEHIKAQHSEIANDKDRKEYMEGEKRALLRKKEADACLGTLIDSFVAEINTYLANPAPDENNFRDLAERIDRSIDGFDLTDMHRLGNLALLSKNDNSAFGNRPFYEKRDMLNQWIEDPSKNIPHSTIKAFHKMYSTQEYKLDFTRWARQDFNGMFAQQIEMLKINDYNGKKKGFIKEI